jgi:hypothetical protein
MTMGMTANSLRLGGIAVMALHLLSLPAGAQPGRDLNVQMNRPMPPGVGAPSRPINLSLVPTTANVLHIGSAIGFRLGASASGYVHLYALSASGKVQLWLENVPIRPGRSIVYPGDTGTIRAMPPAGDERIVMVVTRQPLAGFARGSTQSPLVLPYSHSEFRELLAAKTSMLQPREWASTESIVRVEDR